MRSAKYLSFLARIGGDARDEHQGVVGPAAAGSRPAVSSGRGVSCSDIDTCDSQAERRLAREVRLRAQLGGRAERIGQALGGALVVGREGDAHVAVVEDGVVVPVGPVDLVQGLRHQEGAHAVAGQEGQRRLEEVEPAERGELVEHQQEPSA